LLRRECGARLAARRVVAEGRYLALESEALGERGYRITEFNNVLVPIILFTEAAMNDLPQDSPSRSDLERVLASSRRAKNVVQKILTFSRVLGDGRKLIRKKGTG